MFKSEVDTAVVHRTGVTLAGAVAAKRGCVFTANALQEVIGVLIEYVDFSTELAAENVEVKTDVVRLGGAPFEVTLEIRAETISPSNAGIS